MIHVAPNLRYSMILWYIFFVICCPVLVTSMKQGVLLYY